MWPLDESWARTFDLILKAVAALIAAWWALRVYSAEREKDRQVQVQAEQRARDDAAARYTLPFMRASEDLRSRLYNVLKLQALGPLRQQYPDGAHAYEILYLMAQYSGWQSVIERHSEYGRDQVVIDSTAAVRDALSSDRSPYGSALRLFRPQQRNLGQMAVVRAGDPAALIFDAVAFDEFINRLNQDFPGRASVEDFLHTLRVAETVNDLVVKGRGDGRRRLAEVQMLLGRLLEHLETKENIRPVPKGARATSI